MSQENVEIIKAAIDAWSAGDMDRFGDFYDPTVVLHTVPDWPEPGPFVGREAVMRLFRQVRATWESDAVEPISDFIDVGERVLVRHTWRVAGRDPEVSLAITNVLTVRKGRIVHQEFFREHAEALKAVGLEE